MDLDGLYHYYLVFHVLQNVAVQNVKPSIKKEKIVFIFYITIVGVPFLPK